MTLGAGEPVTIQRRVPVVPIGIVSFSGSTLAVGASSVDRNLVLTHKSRYAESLAVKL